MMNWMKIDNPMRSTSYPLASWRVKPYW